MWLREPITCSCAATLGGAASGESSPSLGYSGNRHSSSIHTVEDTIDQQILTPRPPFYFLCAKDLDAQVPRDPLLDSGDAVCITAKMELDVGYYISFAPPLPKHYISYIFQKFIHSEPIASIVHNTMPQNHYKSVAKIR